MRRLFFLLLSAAIVVLFFALAKKANEVKDPQGRVINWPSNIPRLPKQ